MFWCSHCNRHTPGVSDYASGTVSCGGDNGCGRVLSQDIYSDDPTFVKGAGGQSRAEGNLVRTIQASYFRALEKGKSKIHELVVLLGLGDSTGDLEGNKRTPKTLAENFYQIVLEKSFTKGRRTDEVAAACLYTACRVLDWPYLLIDFSNCLSINVYVLGAVFLQLCPVLSLQEHSLFKKPVDPSLFIDRYTEALVGENNLMISKTALNIVASMKRDWMQTGRKPGGLCGAAVYISALSHGFKCSKLDIAKVVHVCEATLTKRLIEFENTNSGSLTIEEFNKNAKELKNEDHLSKLSDASSRNSDRMKVLCKHKDEKVEAVFAGLCKDCCDIFFELSGGLHGGADPPAFQRAERERSAKESSEKEVERLAEANHVIEPETADFIESPTTSTSVVGDQVVNDAADLSRNSNDINNIPDEPDSLSDIDDAEVCGYLNSEEECKYKKIIWEELNKEYLQEQAAKKAAIDALTHFSGASGDVSAAQELAAAARAAVTKSREERRQKRASEAKNGSAAQTAAEATRQMLTKKRLSSKINYDVLDKLFDEPLPPDSKRAHVEYQYGGDIDGQKLNGKTDVNNDEQYQQNGGIVAEEEEEEEEEKEACVDGWDFRHEEEAFDYGYYDNDGDNDY